MTNSIAWALLTIIYLISIYYIQYMLVGAQDMIAALASTVGVFYGIFAMYLLGLRLEKC